MSDQPPRRVCLLTGAGGVLGQDFCRRWRHDYAIVAVYRRRPPRAPSQGAGLVDPLAPGAALPDNRSPVFAVQSDLDADAEVERVVELALARFGQVDLLVNAAVHVRHDRLTSLAGSADFLDTTFSVNVTLPARLAAVLAREHWLHRRAENEAWGRNVVNLSSMAAFGLVPGAGLSAYSASKAALNLLTAHLAYEFGGFGVRVNALAPTSFPRLIPTSAVSDAIVDLDRSDLTGTLVQLDEHGTRELH